ncbi:hypothetical protein V7S43_001118 [Phytophthora oleae]|uniref:separase n=1 Tax=Phytophthora oleae TaxID=2107226 RepID=A0ABD3G644_9STRA
MGGKVEDVGATSREQLLALVQRRGAAQRVLTIFKPIATSLVRNISVKSTSSSTLNLLSLAIEQRHSDWAQALTGERDAKRQRVSSSSKSDVVFAAKMAQSLVKVYAPIGGATAKAEELTDLVAAMDLDCVALYVVCALEHTVRLGDFVVDNLLYQVAKKYAEMPTMRESAVCVAACVHVRLWNAHAKLCEGTGDEKSQLTKLLDGQNEDSNALESKLVQQLELAALFPKPASFHTTQFARLLVGHTSVCISVLSAAKNYEAVLQVAKTTLSPWISHLQTHDAKLASSFSDRTFRTLWKIASAAEGNKQKTDSSSAALQFRSTALPFLLKCSNYSSSYFIQQVHRVGVQHERSTKRSQRGLKELYTFYDRSANALSEAFPNSTLIYSSDPLQWEYIQWLEHFSVVSELSGMHLRSAMILEHAVQYSKLFGSTGEPVESCLLFSTAGALFSAVSSANREIYPSWDRCDTSVIVKKLEAGTGRMIRDLCERPSAKWADQCEKTARVYLKKLEVLAPFSFVSLGSEDFPVFVPFMTRMLRRSATKAFNYAINAQHSAKYQLYHQVITNFDELGAAIRKLRAAVADMDAKIVGTLILEEARLHRMAVILSVRCCLADLSATTKPALHMISRHVTLVRGLLNDATMDGKISESILQGVLGDLNSIARECYSCATRCYKTRNYQDTISALLGAFKLMESYLEYVVCSNYSTDDMNSVHVQLKVDAIASLLAHCFRELGDVTKCRLFTGYSLTYCGNIQEEIPRTSVDKYVSCTLEELQFVGEDSEPSITSAFKTFLDNTNHIFKARRIPEDQFTILWREFRDAFGLASTKIVVSLRGKEFAGPEDEADNSLTRVHLCGVLEDYLTGELMKSKIGVKTNGNVGRILLDVSHSLTKRKQIYCSYYTKRNFSHTIKELLLVHHSLTIAAEHLQSLSDVVGVDLGGIYGWRGVITMELALMASYAGLSDGAIDFGNVSADEESAIVDFEQCLKYWSGGDACGLLFDKTYMVYCLTSMCNALSLTSWSPLEISARKLLKTLQSERYQDAMPPPLLTLLGMDSGESVSVPDAGIVASSNEMNTESKLFEQVDKELLAAQKCHLGDIRDQAYQHLFNAITILHDIKQDMRKGQAVTVAKAIGMRELFVHTILSDIHFHEGRSNYAIAEAKSALRVCWKMAKKFTASSSTSEAQFFKLPPEISTAQNQQRKATQFLYFMALECSSWDVLLAAKVLLCRVASLYSLSDQPHRSAAYLTEAMRLVGGLSLHFFRRGPFYEYAELELKSSHVEKAKVAISLLKSSPKADLKAGEVNNAVSGVADALHPCTQPDLAPMEQYCNEVVQQGDVYLNEGRQQEAMASYTKAIDVMGTEVNHSSKRLGRVKTRCWRKLTRLQSQIIDFSDLTAVETLLGSMKKLKRELKSCGVQLERVKCMLELGRINIRLLRSDSPRAFMNLDRTIASLEEALLLGDHLGIPHLSQQLRTALGVAYFAEIEENARGAVNFMEKDDRATFLSWASSSLMANAGSGYAAGKDPVSLETESDTPSQNALVVQLQQLVAGSRTRQDLALAPCDHLARMTRNIAGEVQQLPDNWTIVSLMIGLSSELVISRFPTNGSAPTSFRLPQVAWAKCIHEMDDIIQSSRGILSGHTAEEASSWNTEQKKEWWNARKMLDKRIGDTIVSMQETLGFWRCLLVGGPSTIETQVVQRCWSLLTKTSIGCVRLFKRNQILLCALADAQECLTDGELIDGLRHIGAEIGVPISNSLAREVLQVLRIKQNGPESTSSKVTHSNLTKLSKKKIAGMKVGEVKQYLAAEGLSTDGLKKALVGRLLAARDTALAVKLRSSTEDARVGISPEFSTILILNHQLQQFPWEGVDVMSLCSGVTRMPSLDLIVQNARLSSLVRRDRVRYLLNPAGDLTSTQTELGPILVSGATTYGWEGIIGEVPDPDELRNYLLAADLYIYCGHGSGEAYFHRDKVLGLQSNCSAALLFGCSSGRLEREGIFGPSGAVLAYLRAGSPAVLAMLWDVTDRDIDQLSVKLLEEWLLSDNEENPSLAQVLQGSRDVCKLKYLNGHAAVCYGLPLYAGKS